MLTHSAVMMFQPRSRQQVTALTQSYDLARVYRDDAVRDSEMISPKHSAMISPGTKAAAAAGRGGVRSRQLLPSAAREQGTRRAVIRAFAEAVRGHGVSSSPSAGDLLQSVTPHE
jgi:hypothetical protein